jgi:Domain of unknown function (DUF4157)
MRAVIPPAPGKNANPIQAPAQARADRGVQVEGPGDLGGLGGAIQGSPRVQAQFKLQQEAGGSARGQAQLQLRQELNGSSHVRSLKAMQTAMNNGPQATAQARLRDEFSAASGAGLEAEDRGLEGQGVDGPGPEERDPSQRKTPAQRQTKEGEAVQAEAPDRSEGLQPESAVKVSQAESGSALLQKKPAEEAGAQLKEDAGPAANRTGLPDSLKTGVETLSGLSLDDVKVHYNSARPAQLQALAYAQGTDIHVGPGQEKHLAHETWHVVQQKQGRVRPTMQMREGVKVNDDSALEKDADVMGARASRAGKTGVRPAVVPRRGNQSTGQRVVQGWWVMKGLEESQQQEVSRIAQGNPIAAFITWLNFMREYSEYELEYLAENKSLLNEDVARLLSETFHEKADGFNARYLFQKIQEIVDTTRGILEVHEETGDSDHPEGSDVKEELIDWADLTPQGLSRLPKEVLFLIFQNLALYHFQKAGAAPEVDLGKAFSEWYRGGVHTRAQFKRLIGLSVTGGDEQDRIIQLKRTGNSYTQQDAYSGKNSVGYRNVIYYRDGQGNIDFTRNPATVLAGYNKAFGAKIKPSDINWSDPQDAGSKVQMSQDLKNPRKGVMPSGKSVELPKASRAQHFAIADMLYPNSRSGTWTWHHLSKEYQMVLVDMTVHAKHGHNGGVYIWK